MKDEEKKGITTDGTVSCVTTDLGIETHFIPFVAHKIVGGQVVTQILINLPSPWKIDMGASIPSTLTNFYPSVQNPGTIIKKRTFDVLVKNAGGTGGVHYICIDDANLYDIGFSEIVVKNKDNPADVKGKTVIHHGSNPKKKPGVHDSKDE